MELLASEEVVGRGEGGEGEKELIFETVEFDAWWLSAGDRCSEGCTPFDLYFFDEDNIDVFTGYGAATESGIDREEIGYVVIKGGKHVRQVGCLGLNGEAFVLFEDTSDDSAICSGSQRKGWVSIAANITWKSKMGSGG